MGFFFRSKSSLTADKYFQSKPETSAIIEFCNFPSIPGVNVDVENQVRYSITGVPSTVARKCVTRRQRRDGFDVSTDNKRYDNKEMQSDRQSIRIQTRLVKQI